MDRKGGNKEGRNPWQYAQHVWLYTDLLQALKGEPLSSVFSTDATLISASVAPHCRRGGVEEASSKQGSKRISVSVPPKSGNSTTSGQGLLSWSLPRLPLTDDSKLKGQSHRPPVATRPQRSAVMRLHERVPLLQRLPPKPWNGSVGGSLFSVLW